MQPDSRKSRLELLKDRVGKEIPKEEAETAPSPQKPTQDIMQPKPLGDQYIMEQEKLKYVEFERGVQPTVHDMRGRRTRKINWLGDERILPYVDHYLAHGPGISKSDRMNRAMLEFLLSKGYPIDPDILDRPFREEDVPRPPKR